MRVLIMCGFLIVKLYWRQYVVVRGSVLSIKNSESKIRKGSTQIPYQMEKLPITSKYLGALIAH